MLALNKTQSPVSLSYMSVACFSLVCNQSHADVSPKFNSNSLNSMSGTALEDDSESILRAITPILDPNRHKVQAGKIAVIGGCRVYTGAPYFAAISALKMAADLSHLFCTKDAAPVLKGNSTELIMHPILEESYSISGLGDEERKRISSKILAEVDKWMERFDCLVVGPGLGRDPYFLEGVSEIMKHARQSNFQIVIDGVSKKDEYGLVKQYAQQVHCLSAFLMKFLINGSSLLACPHISLGVAFPLLIRIGGVTSFQKGKSDLISDGDTFKSVSIYGSLRRCGGHGGYTIRKWLQPESRREVFLLQ
ncbi:hypothetical protein QYF36_014094 [Acer negundo]|nr:hypothetical protein QYF36_014094 [Acer negundo]